MQNVQVSEFVINERPRNFNGVVNELVLPEKTRVANITLHELVLVGSRPLDATLPMYEWVRGTNPARRKIWLGSNWWPVKEYFWNGSYWQSVV